jgi:serine/threonine protein kinase
MVHRDFKPANVLVGDDGRVRIVDFGLARALEHGDTGEQPIRELDVDALGTVTHEGVLVGTPSYMAPEQFDGTPADARADQYAYCVSFYEALYGRVPFEGADLRAMLAAKRAGRVALPNPGIAVPEILHEVILRGLSADPAKRFAAMPDLLRELRRIGEATSLGSGPEQEQSRAVLRRRRVIAIALVLVAIVVVVLSWQLAS